jgi:quercetin dioxygenase-like cupin family protein
MEIFTQPPTTKGPAETFTGDVWVDLVHAGPKPGRSRLSVVRFAPGARSHWHGAAAGRFMARLALMESDDSDAPQTSWGGKVTDADYAAPRASTR